MPDIDSFIEGIARELRSRLSATGRSGRATMEDRITLLTDYRLGGMDEARFERLLAMMRAGRSPVRMFVEQPQAIAADLTQRWQEYRREVAVTAAN